jgi:hypothetical protein
MKKSIATTGITMIATVGSVAPAVSVDGTPRAATSPNA